MKKMCVMNRCIKVLLILVVMAFGFSPIYIEAKELPRKVLRLYNSEDQLSIIDNELDRGLEMVMDHLGMRLEYYDLSKGLPSDETMKRYRAVIVWLYDYDFKDAIAYWNWQKRQLDNGIRAILLQQPRPGLIRDTHEETQMELINRSLKKMNFEIGLNYANFPPDLEIVDIKPEMVSFERKIESELPYFYESKNLSKENDVYLKIKQKSKNLYSDVVVASPLGGIVMGDYVYYMDPYTFVKQWRLNPFKYFSKTLGIDNKPRFDVTTLNGRRIFYSHIDGDGVNNRTTYRKNMGQITCGDIIYEEVLKKYSTLPITVSFVTAEVDPKHYGSKHSFELAKKIYLLDNIEPASHTFTHPLVWNTETTRPQDMEKYKEIADMKFTNGAMLVYNPKNYEYSAESEIKGSIDYINEHLVPEGKRCELLLWSGNCLPGTREMEVIKKYGYKNLNGGDGRYDEMYPSYFYLAPFTRKVGRHTQFHSSHANDNLYIKNGDALTNGSFQNMITTFEMSEKPRRVTAMNIYYHFFSGANKAAVQSLIALYDYVLSQPIFPIYASQYVDVVDGFLKGRIYELGPNRWKITNNGACQTLRFDGTDLYPDMKRSKGVLGYKIVNDSMYVSLSDDKVKVLQLSSKRPRLTYLSESSGPVNNLKKSKKSLSYETVLFGKTIFIWKNFPAHQLVTISFKTEKGIVGTEAVKVKKDGTLDYTVEGMGKASVEVSF